MDYVLVAAKKCKGCADTVDMSEISMRVRVSVLWDVTSMQTDDKTSGERESM